MRDGIAAAIVLVLFAFMASEAFIAIRFMLTGQEQQPTCVEPPERTEDDTFKRLSVDSKYYHRMGWTYRAWQADKALATHIYDRARQRTGCSGEPLSEDWEYLQYKDITRELERQAREW